MVRITLLAAFACVLAIVAVEILVAATDYSFGYFASDPATTQSALPLIGVLSNLGVLLLWATATACAFAGALVAREQGRSAAAPLALAAVGLGYAALDDLFMLHEWAYGRKLGIPEQVVLTVYAVPVLAYLWWYRELLRKRDWPLLALAGGLLALSALFDYGIGDLFALETRQRLEDSCKLFGYAFLSVYFVALAVRTVEATFRRERVRSPRNGAPREDAAAYASSPPEPASAVVTPSPM